jgi:hypothetical protein
MPTNLGKMNYIFLEAQRKKSGKNHDISFDCYKL